jgi:hypothetical protein
MRFIFVLLMIFLFTPVTNVFGSYTTGQYFFVISYNYDMNGTRYPTVTFSSNGTTSASAGSYYAYGPRSQALRYQCTVSGTWALIDSEAWSMDAWAGSAGASLPPCNPPPECAECTQEQLFDCDTRAGVTGTDCATIQSADPETCQATCDCDYKESRWTAAFCGGSGDIVQNYDCITDTGECETYCDQLEAFWITAFCNEPGDIFNGYDCLTETGDCDTYGCQQLEENWTALYCPPGSGLVVESFDCSTGKGVCKNVDCVTKEAAYLANFCQPGDILDNYDCAINSGNCVDQNCQTSKSAWQAASCDPSYGYLTESFNCVTGVGVCQSDDCRVKKDDWAVANNCLSVESYNCSNNTGVCEAGANLECEVIKNTWMIATGCITATSFDCETNTGVCSDNVGSADTQIVLDKLQSMDTNTDTWLSWVYDALALNVQGLIDSPSLALSLVTGLWDQLTTVFPNSECQPITFASASMPALSFTVDCTFATKFKQIFGFIFGFATCFLLADILYTEIVPRKV